MTQRNRREEKLSIDWDASKPNPALFQIPSRSKKNLLTTLSAPVDETKKDADGKPFTADRSYVGSQAQSDDSSRSATAPAATQPRSAAHESREPQWRPDVYVHAFVPESFTAINRSPCSMIETPKVEGINFDRYIATFAGSQFLSALPPLPLLKPHDEKFVDSLMLLRPANYGKHFDQCLALDLEARIPEIRSYDLFGATLELKDQTQRIFSLRVPGIKEGTPLVSLGDLVLLRQLVLDAATGLPQGMHAWLAPGGGCARGEQAPGFTGYQLNATVVGVDKANESLLIRALGMLWAERYVCNVSFTVQARLIQGPQRAVGDIAKELSSDIHRLEHSGITKRLQEDMTCEPDPRTLSYLKNAGYGKINPVIGPRQQPQDFVGIESIPQGLWLEGVLFPNEVNGVRQTSLPSGTFSQDWFDENLNYEQKVRHVRSLVLPIFFH